MHILIVIDDYFPSTKSGPKMVHDLGIQLLRQAHAVSILTPSAAVHNPIDISREDGLQIIRVRTGELKAFQKYDEAGMRSGCPQPSGAEPGNS